MTVEQPLALEAESGPEPDRRILLHGLVWEQYEDLLRALGDSTPGVRVAYLEGTIEIMSPSGAHERQKKMVARLIEAWAEEKGVTLNGYGSTTFRRAAKERGVEPDECYTLGRDLGGVRDIPDIAIEVIHESPLLDKLSIYGGLGIPEFWLWRRGAFEVYVLSRGEYERRERSALLPDLDLALVASLADETDQTETVRRFRRAIRG